MTTASAYTPSFAVGLDLPIKSIGRGEGLPSSQVHSLVEDRAGRFWFAGPGGLAQYDGARVTAYDTRKGLSSQGLRSLAAGPDGRVWIGSDVGLDVLETNGTIRPAVEAAQWHYGFVETILVEPSGKVWLGTPQGLLWLSPEGHLHPVNDPRLRNTLVNCLAQDRFGRIWAGGQFGLLYLEGHRFQAPPVEGWREVGSIRVLLLAPDNSILVGGDRGLVQLSPEGAVLRRLDRQNQTVNAIHLEQEELWLGTSGELRRYRATNEVWQLEATVLAETQVNDLARDWLGNLWVASDNRAVLRVSALRKALLRPDLSFGGGVYAVRPTRWGDFLVGGETSSWRMGLGQPIKASLLKGLNGYKVWDLLEDPQQRIWAATQEGLMLLEGDEARAVAPQDPLLSSPNRVLLERGDKLWVGTVRGLSVVWPGLDNQPRYQQVTDHSGNPLGYIYTLLEDHTGRLWVGSVGNGLWYESKQGFVQVVGEGLKAKGNVYAMALHPDGTLVVIQDNRIVRLQISDPGRSSLITESLDPVAGWSAHLVGERLWIGSSSGLHEYDLYSGQHLRQITAWLGLSGWEFTTSRSLTTDAKGRFVCGLNSGLMVVDPLELEKYQAIPKVHLGQVQWSNTQFQQKGTFFQVKQGKWKVELDFFSPWFLSEDQLLYRYRLLGFDSSWSEPSPLARIQYSSLPAGQFTVEVQAYAAMVGWGSVTSLVTIRVAPPPFTNILADVLGLAGARWRNRRLWKQNLALEQYVRERTEELNQAYYELSQLNVRLEALSRTDTLTGVANRRLFEETAHKEFKRAQRDKTPTSLILLDIDHFKKYNDTFGHPQGDVCLRQVAQGLIASVRDSGDLVARYGGEEFAIILPNANPQEASLIAERLRTTIEGLQILHPTSEKKVVTASIGVATHWPGTTPDFEELLSIADQALYRAKHAGRNQVVSI